MHFYSSDYMDYLLSQHDYANWIGEDEDLDLEENYRNNMEYMDCCDSLGY